MSFYANLEIWSSIKNKFTKTVKGKKRQLGINCRLQVKKNRLTGQERTVEIPIYHSFGIDDIGSCVDYLVNENCWSIKGNTINASEFDFKGSRTKLISYIEDNDMEKDLRDLVGDTWNEIEAACSVKRKKRYE